MKIPNIVEKLYDVHKGNIKRFPCHANRASAIGTECLRQLVYMRVAWEEAELPTIERQLNFDEGHVHEREIMSDLIKTGVPIIEQQFSFKDDMTNITGHLDAVILFEVVENQTVVDKVKIPLEVKSCAPHIFDALRSYGEDEYMKAMTELGELYPWLKKYPAQILSYCFAKSAKFGIIIFKNKSNGRMKQFVLDLEKNMSYLDAVFEKAKKVNRLVKKFYNRDGSKKFKPDSPEAEKVLPPRVSKRDECRFCDYKFLCLPDVDFGSPLKINDDPSTEAKIENYFLYEHFEKARKKINEDLKAKCQNVDNVIVGRFHITGKADKKGVWRKKIDFVDDLARKEIEEKSKRLVELIERKKSVCRK